MVSRTTEHPLPSLSVPDGFARPDKRVLRDRFNDKTDPSLIYLRRLKDSSAAIRLNKTLTCVCVWVCVRVCLCVCKDGSVWDSS